MNTAQLYADCIFTIVNMQAETDALRAQRDALLAALRAMLAKHDDRDGASDLWPREAAMAREAIAAATREG
jgi:hypothetical protein